MVKKEVNRFLHKNVRIELFDGSIYTGILKLGAERIKGYYYCSGRYTDYIFRSSHVKSIKVNKR